MNQTPGQQHGGFKPSTKLCEEPELETANPGQARDTAHRGHRRTDADTRLTVIIPTKDRAGDLQRAVASLLRQTKLPDELVIVDQSKTGEAAEAVKRLFAARSAGTAGCSTDLTYERDAAISGLAQARNRAIGLASGDVWLFLDDDVELEPDFIRELLTAYERFPDAAGISGIITNYRPAALPFRAWAAVFVRGPFRDDRQPVYVRADALANADPVRATRLGGGLMSFRAAAVGQARFDENLTGVCDAEDVDFCLQLGPRARLLIAPRARLIHKQSASGRAIDHWLRRFSQANCYLFHRHWHGERLVRAYFAWLRIGFALAAGLACVRSRSRAPWMALRSGLLKGRRVARALERMNEGQKKA